MLRPLTIIYIVPRGIYYNAPVVIVNKVDTIIYFPIGVKVDFLQTAENVNRNDNTVTRADLTQNSLDWSCYNAA